MTARFAHDLLRALVQHQAKDMAAQLAFWLVLALFPFLIFLLTVIGFIPLHGLDQEVLGMFEAKWRDVRVVPDLAGIPRVLAARKEGER